MTEATFDISTHEALIKDLTAIVQSANKGEDALNKAKDKANNASDRSVRDLASRVSKINEDLSKEAIGAICESVANKIANGNANVKKARKSELKLCLEQRTHIASVINCVDDANKHRGGKDEPKKLNLRSATLGSLRVIKKDKSVTPGNAVDTFIGKTDHVETPAEKMAKHIKALTGSDFFKSDDEIHPNAKRALEALTAAVNGDMEPLEGLCEPEEETTPDEQADDLLAGQGLVLGDVGADEMEQVSSEVQLAAIDIDFQPEETAIPVEAPEDDEFDIDTLTKGLL